ncbi:XrtA system polysaccharide chain length determinant [Salinisphaera orenii]|uniref:Tyrosine-protein kinase G-rich domain-containing protein n=1 Tax=Salinisphaera orenii YIM 95161 TaxID=1051139 RepID=A0A423Q3I3_9GAMM|nr:XrtA system polysaccharide chain length determinant [Salinisphaera halophila]ROO33093.1 hypothetical protein SAHL_04165 [Salinisphaera halophila YIM 95161]
MQELFSLVLEQLRNIWRFRWLALAIAWVIAIVGWVYVYSMPNEYRSEARVHIDTKSAIRPLLSGMTVMPDVSRQVELLIGTVLSRPHLRDIARRTGLDLQATTPEEEQALLDQLDQRIQLTSTNRNTDVYRVAYTGGDAEVAQAVVQQVLNIMTDMAVSDNANGEDSANATAFLSEEVDNYEERLAESERKLAEFKKENPELIPGSDDYVSRVKRANARIDELNDQLAMARQRRSSLQQQLSGRGGSTSVTPERSQQVQSIDARITEQQRKIEQLLTKYTPEHPDVASARREIERLRQSRSDTIAELRANPGQAVSASAAGDNTSVLSQQLDAANVEIETLQSSIERQRSQLEGLRSGADEMTDAQAQLAKMTRNYNVTQDQYQKLLTRLYSARLSTDVRQHNDPLEFRVIDPPEVPAEPFGPQRVILLTMALFAAAAAGIAFAFFLGQIRPVFINRKSLTDATGLPVVGSVSMAWSTGQRAQRHTGLLLFLVCAGTLIVGYVGAVVLAPVGARLVPALFTGQLL